MFSCKLAPMAYLAWRPTMIRRTLMVCVCAVVAGETAVAQNVAAAEQQHIDKVVACLHDPVMTKDDPCIPLAKRMEQLHVQGVSVAVIRDGKIAWAQGFGVAKIGGPAVTSETMF